MILVWSAEAIDDRNRIMDYIALDNPLAAIELDELIESKANKLIERPKLYQESRRLTGVREMVVHPNYIVIYRILVESHTVEVLNVKHAAQQWP